MAEVKPQLKRVEFFSPDPQLNRTISELERNTRDTTDQLARKRQEVQTPTKVRVQSHLANFGETVMCDPGSSGFTVYLPNGTSRDAGRKVTVKNTTTSVAIITVRPGRGAELDDSTIYAAGGSKFSYTFTFDGKDWWLG